VLGSNPEPACLLIADISGYTEFLAGAELDHAQDILADLMATVVGSLRPTFRLAKLEGDAAFAYVATERIDAAMLQDTVERCYFAFRRRLRDIGQASTCDCNACILVPSLDLKVVAHHGRIVRQRIAGRDELLGSDVIVVHRLLKNRVEESTGARAYALYTATCTAAMGLDDPAAAGLAEHREEFEGVGEVVGWVHNLEAAWQDEMDRVRVVVEAIDAARTYTATFAAPPSVVWDYVTSPIRRPSWQQGVSVVDERPGQPGRRGVGTVNHCMHGKEAIVEEVLDWRPYDYVTYRAQLPEPGTPPLVETYLFEDDGVGGTRFEMRFHRPKSAKQRSILEAMLPGLDEMINRGLTALRPMIDAEMAARAAAVAASPGEPSLAESAGRNLTEPIARTA
jgi:uncharacterized protein YndB with AHSA1/START domain